MTRRRARRKKPPKPPRAKNGNPPPTPTPPPPQPTRYREPFVMLLSGLVGVSEQWVKGENTFYVLSYFFLSVFRHRQHSLSYEFCLQAFTPFIIGRRKMDVSFTTVKTDEVRVGSFFGLTFKTFYSSGHLRNNQNSAIRSLFLFACFFVLFFA